MVENVKGTVVVLGYAEQSQVRRCSVWVGTLGLDGWMEHWDRDTEMELEMG